MAFDGSNYLCDSFKTELLNGEMDFSADTTHTYKIALYTSSAVGTSFGGDGAAMDASVRFYAVTNEVAGTGYVAGGETLTPVAPTEAGGVAYIDFEDVSWATATITARGAIIYRSDVGAPTNDAIAVIDFGSDRTSTAGTFTVQFPTADSANAIVRVG